MYQVEMRRAHLVDSPHPLIQLSPQMVDRFTQRLNGEAIYIDRLHVLELVTTERLNRIWGGPYFPFNSQKCIPEEVGAERLNDQIEFFIYCILTLQLKSK